MAADTVGHTASLMCPAVHGLPVLSLVCVCGVCGVCACMHACAFVVVSLASFPPVELMKGYIWCCLS